MLVSRMLVKGSEGASEAAVAPGGLLPRERPRVALVVLTHPERSSRPRGSLSASLQSNVKGATRLLSASRALRPWARAVL